MGCKYPLTLSESPAMAAKTRFPERFTKYRTVRCGRCVWCRWMNALAWAVRIVNEVSITEGGCSFLTLTYHPKQLPEAEKYPRQGTLEKKHLQDFLKRLRSRLEYHDNIKIRYFACGEYGHKNGRAHYHVIVFGYTFPDRKMRPERSKHGYRLYNSDLLSSLWKFGFSTTQDVDAGVAKYVGQYSTKKITGAKAPEFYKGRLPEFVITSTKPGIGTEWYERNKRWLWNEQGVIRIPVKGEVVPFYAPLYYERKLKAEDPEAYSVWLQAKERRNWRDIRNQVIQAGAEGPDEVSIDEA